MKNLNLTQKLLITIIAGFCTYGLVDSVVTILLLDTDYYTMLKDVPYSEQISLLNKIIFLIMVS